MRGATAHLPDIGRAGVGRLVVTWLALLAFALQSYITQTHIHLDLAAAERAPMVAVGGPISGGAISAHSPAPTEHEEIACPFCQAIAAAGGFVTPAHVAPSFLVSQAETAVLPPIAVGAAIAAGFSWRSRAPPQS
jgi:hypothetical protein